MRHQGIATKLVDVARTNTVFGLSVPRNQLAISSPTVAGWEFYQRYCHGKKTGQNVLVYDYES